MHLLDEPHILGEAARRFGVETPVEDQFRPALSALLRALHTEARLSADARERSSEHLIRAIGKRVALAKLEREEPQVETTSVAAPIVITGLPRTGTTLLHNLLSRVEGLWAPALWQLRAPVCPAPARGRPDPKGDPEAAAAGKWRSKQREATAARHERLYAAAPSLRAIHPMDPDWPDECNWLLRNCFCTLVNAFNWYVPGYVEFLRVADMRPAYHDHRRWLRALLFGYAREQHTPRLVLKDPFHMWHLEDLLAVYPDATIVHLHRQPSEIVPSLASMCATLQAIDTDAPRRPVEIGRFCLYALDQGLRSHEEARERIAGDRFIDLSYRELLAAPGAVVRRLGERLGFAGEGVAVEQASRWLEDNRQHKAGRHRYTLDDFGLSEAVIDEYFAAYHSRFAPLLA